MIRRLPVAAALHGIATLAVLAVAVAAPASPAAAKAGDVLVRLRAIMVSPNESSSAVLPAFPGSGASVTDSFAPELDFTYMITNHIGAELVLATTKHSIYAEGSIAGVGKVADTWVLPPTLTLQYHFVPDGKVRPYVGVGVNQTWYYNEHTASSLIAAIGPTKTTLGSSFGYALQAGVDIDLNKRFFLNADVKYVDMVTRARFETGGATNSARVSIDPFIFGVGLGMRF